MRLIYRILLALLLLLVVAAGITLPRALKIGAGYTAKIACSCAFVSGRDDASILAEDASYLGFMSTVIDRQNRSATTTTYGYFPRTAIYREGLGCTLLSESTAAELATQAAGYSRPESPELAGEPWPLGDAEAVGLPPTGTDEQAVAALLDRAFDDSWRDDPARTRAIIVVHDGKIIAERYAEGFTERTPLLGWSMAKSVTGALVGVLVDRDRLVLEEPPPLPAWDAGDPRSQITLEQMLHMESGLDWTEWYLMPYSDVLTMLFLEPSAPGYAMGQGLGSDPGMTFRYSSGVTNIIQRAIRNAVDGELTDYWRFPYESLFYPAGMTSAIMEPDAGGTFVGSSYMFATARDWARFGLLFLNDGRVLDRQVLPARYVAWCAESAPTAPFYGGHWWLNRGGWFEDAPTDTMTAQGHDGQYVTVIPSRDLVVVRLGLSFGRSWDHGEFLTGLLDALGESS